MKQLTKTANAILLLIIMVSFVTIACDSSPSDSDSDIDSGADSGQTDSDIGGDHDADTEDDGGSKTANYYPLEVGMRWEYKLSNGMKRIDEVIGEELHHGKNARVIRVSHPDAGIPDSFTYFAVENEDILTHSNKGWTTFLALPPDIDQIWEYNYGTFAREYEWEFVGDYSAGSKVYSNCYKSVNITRNQDIIHFWSIYAPNVGTVHASGASGTSELISLSE